MRLIVFVLAALAPPTAALAECPHPYLPLPAGTTWVYEVSGPMPGRLSLTVRVPRRGSEGTSGWSASPTGTRP